MELFQNGIQIVENLKITNQTRSNLNLNGYNATKEKLNENSKLIIKQPVANEKAKTKVSIGFY